MKRFISLLLAIVMIATSSNVISASENLYDAEDSLATLWDIGKESFELIDSNTDNSYFLSRFFVDGTEYQIEETVEEESKTIVESTFYRITKSDKEYLGVLTTTIEQEEESLLVTMQEDDITIDTQSFLIEEDSIEPVSSDQLTEGLHSLITPFAAVEYAWHSQGKTNGSNRVAKYTVAAIVNMLAYAAGGATATGLATVANSIISDKWETVYWRRETWIYNQRCPDWPSYPHWIQAGKYKYHTDYYSDSSRTKHIGSSHYING